MVIVNTVGVYFAARSHFTIKNAVKSVFSLPAIYAAILALLFRTFDLTLPSGIASGISIIADSYSPIVLAILGIQMTNVKTDKLERITQTAFWTGMGMRLLVAPMIALVVLKVLNIEGILHSVLLVLACMPVAVNGGILAQKFDVLRKLSRNVFFGQHLFLFFFYPLLLCW